MVVFFRRKIALLVPCVILIFAARLSAHLPADSHAKIGSTRVGTSIGKTLGIRVSRLKSNGSFRLSGK